MGIGTDQGSSDWTKLVNVFAFSFQHVCVFEADFVIWGT